MFSKAAQLPPQTKRGVLLAIALLPCGLSVVFHAIDPVPAKATPAPRPPALAFDQYVVNLGAVEPEGLVRGWFAFTNRGDQPVKITEIKPSCGCLNPRLDKREYLPGETGEFPVHVESANEDPGEKEYFVTVNYEDPQPRSAELWFKLVLPEKQVIVRPPSILFYRPEYVATEDLIHREIVVTDYRDKHLEITDVECNSELIHVAIGESDFDVDGNRQLRVIVQVGEKIPAEINSVVTITTNDEAFPKLRVPVLVRRNDAFLQHVGHEK